MGDSTSSLVDWATTQSLTAAQAAEAVARRLFEELHLRAPDLRLWSGVDPVPGDLVGDRDISSVGWIYEALSSAELRRERGAHFTPDWLASGLVAVAFEEAPRTVIDPSVGGGAFLLAAANELQKRGIEPTGVCDRLYGIDIDADAVAVTEASLALWLAARTGESRDWTDQLVVADGLVEDWPLTAPTAVVGNPPFLSQLRSVGVRDPEYMTQVEQRLGRKPEPYVDTAALFLERSVNEVADHGVVCLVLPTSVAASDDAATVRATVSAAAVPTAVWRDDSTAFEANVNTFAPAFTRGAKDQGTAFFDGRGFERTTGETGAADSWPWMLLGPDAEVDLVAGQGTLADIANCTSGFRDEYYAIASAVTEADTDPSGLPVITSGLIDVGANGWSQRPARIKKRLWSAPVATLERVGQENERVARWCKQRLVPKILVASQTRVLEPMIDGSGSRLPITPVVSVEPHDRKDLALVAAVLLAPGISRWLVADRQGTGMSRKAVRVSAKSLSALRLPRHVDRWQAAALVIETAADPESLTNSELSQVAELMADAYETTPETTEWWHGLR